MATLKSQTISIADFIIEELPLPEEMSREAGLPIGILADSKSWHYPPDAVSWHDPKGSGQIWFAILKMRFTIYRVPVAGGYSVFISFRADWLSVKGSGWIPISFELNDSNGGLLIPWNLGPSNILCEWKQPHPVSFQKQLDRDIYELLDSPVLIFGSGEGSWC